jgi:hypothetical protein
MNGGGGGGGGGRLGSSLSMTFKWKVEIDPPPLEPGKPGFDFDIMSIVIPEVPIGPQYKTESVTINIGNFDNNILNDDYSTSKLNIAGGLLAVEDIYNKFFYNHKTYRTTAGVVKNIYRSDGTVRSMRALQFARASKAIEIGGLFASGFMVGEAGYNMATGDATPLDYSDATVGTIGLSASAFSLAGYSIPYVGECVALYGWFRICWDLGQDYGPSTWFNKNKK